MSLPMSSKTTSSIWLLLALSLFALSQAANLVRLADAPPDAIGAWRLTGAALFLFPLAYSRGTLAPLRTTSVKNWGWIVLSGAFFFAHLWTYFYSAHHTKIANCVIIFATNPLFTAMGAFVFFKEKFTSRFAIAYGLAFVSLWLLMNEGLRIDSDFFNSEDSSGKLSGLLSAFLYSGYLLTGKRVRSQFSNLAYTTIIYLVTGLLFLTNGLLNGVPMTGYSANFWPSIIALIAIPTLMGHAIFTYLIQHLNINLLSCSKLIEPIFSSLVALVVFKEELLPTTITAFVLMSFAILILFGPKIRLTPSQDKSQ
jgi:drug/metabolite transporter (DMT)-like permease